MDIVKEFEAEFEPRGWDLRRNHPDGVYADPMTEGAWRGWEAALNYRNKHSDESEGNQFMPRDLSGGIVPDQK